jgi:hypothetical protein
VVDHSYDLENDHILRAFKAIERNQRLFTDGNFARQKWIECQSRFLKNLRIVQNELRYNAMTEFKAEFAKTLLKI